MKTIIPEEVYVFLGVETKDHKELLSFLVRNEDDLNEFMTEFYDGDILRNITMYQRYKRKINKPTLEYGEEMYKKDMKKALAVLMQEPINDSLLNYMFIYNLTYADLYVKFSNNPNESYLGLVKGSDPVGYDDSFLFEI